MQSTSWEMLDWKKQDCREKYQSPQICRWHHPYGRKWRGTKKPLDERERGEWKSWLKLNIQKTKIMASGPITSWEIGGETVETAFSRKPQKTYNYLQKTPKDLGLINSQGKGKSEWYRHENIKNLLKVCLWNINYLPSLSDHSTQRMLHESQMLLPRKK